MQGKHTGCAPSHRTTSCCRGVIADAVFQIFVQTTLKYKSAVPAPLHVELRDLAGTRCDLSPRIDFALANAGLHFSRCNPPLNWISMAHRLPSCFFLPKINAFLLFAPRVDICARATLLALPRVPTRLKSDRTRGAREPLREIYR